MSEIETSTEGQVVDDANLDDFSADFFGQKDADKGTTKPEPELEDKSTDDKVDAEAQKDEDPNEDPDAEFVEAPPKKKTVQDRIDELVKQREDVKRESESQLAKLRQEFEDWKAGTTKSDATKASSEPTPDDLGENGEPKYGLGEFDPAYIKDLTKFTLAQERERMQVEVAKQSQEQEVQRAQQELMTGWNTKMETAKTEYPDFEVKGRELLDGFNTLPTDYSTYLSTVLMSMDKGPDVLYYLSNHPEEARTIVNSGAQRATLALGRIEAKFIEADATKALAKPKVSKAPPPPTERARGTNGAFIQVPADTEDLDAFESEFFKKK